MIEIEIPKNFIVSDEQFLAIVKANESLRFEQTAEGRLIVNPPTGGNTGRRNSGIIAKLWSWANENGGQVFDSSTGFAIPGGGKRSPDASWVSDEQWNKLTDEQKDGFPPIAPEFVIELKSKTDALVELQDKMLIYLDGGTVEGWLIDPTANTICCFGYDGMETWTTHIESKLLAGFAINLDDLR